MKENERQTICEVTNELSEVIADLNAKISWDDSEAYGCMQDRVEKAQRLLLELSEPKITEPGATAFCHSIIDLVEFQIRRVHPFVDKMARSYSVKDGEETVFPNTLLFGEAYYDLENEILELISGLHVVVEVFQGVVSDVSVFTNLADAEEKLEKFKRAHVSEEDERKYGLEPSKIDGSTIFNVQLNGDNTTSNTSKG